MSWRIWSARIDCKHLLKNAFCAKQESLPEIDHKHFVENAFLVSSRDRCPRLATSISEKRSCHILLPEIDHKHFVENAFGEIAARDWSQAF